MIDRVDFPWDILNLRESTSFVIRYVYHRFSDGAVFIYDFLMCLVSESPCLGRLHFCYLHLGLIMAECESQWEWRLRGRQRDLGFRGSGCQPQLGLWQAQRLRLAGCWRFSQALMYLLHCLAAGVSDPQWTRFLKLCLPCQLADRGCPEEHGGQVGGQAGDLSDLWGGAAQK